MSISGAEIYDKGSNLASIVTFNIKNLRFDTLSQTLDNHKVYYSVASIENARIDFQNKGIEKAIRLSPHYFNTVDEIDKLLSIIDSF